MNSKEKKERKLRSIEQMENIKVREWERDDVYKYISPLEWVEWKLKKVG
jgi:hypothetical protein